MKKFLYSGIAALVVFGFGVGVYMTRVNTVATMARVPHAMTRAAGAVKDANTSVTDALRAIGTTSSSASVSATTGD